MNEQPPQGPKYYPVDIRQNRADWFKATLPAFPVLVGIGATEDQARTNLERELYKELERRLRTFTEMPQPVQVRGVNGHAVELPWYVTERIEFVNLMASNKIFLEELADASNLLEKQVRRVLSVDDVFPGPCSVNALMLFDTMKKCGSELLQERAAYGA